MQTTKFLFTMGAMAAVILPLQVHAAPDNEEQAKMREVLRRMMEQSNPSESAPAPMAKPATTPPPVPVVAPQPTKVVPVVVPPPATPVVVPNPQTSFEAVPPPDDAATIARAREALRQKMLELQATTPAPVTAAVIAPSQPQASEPVRPPDAAATVAREREALRQKMLELQATAPVPATPTPVAVKTAAVTPVSTSAYTPIPAPASPLSGSKQARLADLLARYKTDAITAQEYHTQRAAIIAEP